jgi:hypothetical protein
MRRTSTKTAKDQKASLRGVPHERKDQIYASSACSNAEQEDKDRRQRTAHATPTRGRPAPSVPAQSYRVVVDHPPKNRVDGVGR